jgi:hypothetical protein
MVFICYLINSTNYKQGEKNKILKYTQFIVSERLINECCVCMIKSVFGNDTW